ncbi:NCS2 family permease [Anaerococcus porci]|uniref:NCS2 family permease n=1 Tax=Anaerococcus porci TaxID=2652269 RepID=A0A6N7VW92_9FIRM|nr:NCS2 family permease [Anaerococcus porci]MDY3007096.1 NCS2 family permease [Anaerococcus porci]MSS77959.1 NCS2 family permease [Anaerococcus porci]
MDSKTNGFLSRFFHLDENNTNVKTEVIAGITTFITIAYVLIINPQVLSSPFEIMGDGQMAEKISNGVFIGTCLGAFIGTILVAFYAKLPFAQAPGMGLSAFFAYTTMLGMGYSYSQALVIVFISGILFIVITALGIREAIIRAIPDSIKLAMTPGIGLFITIIGLKNAGLVVRNDATLVSLIDFANWRGADGNIEMILGAVLALIGLCIIAILTYKNVKGAILISIISSTIIGIPMGLTKISNLSLNIGPKLSDFFEVSFFNLDFAGLFQGPNLWSSIFTVTMLVLSFSLVNMFDSLGTLLAAAKQSGLVDKNGEVINLKQALMSDAISTAAGALVGTSTVTTVVESSAGIAAGGRTGLTSLTTALLFLLSIIFVPIISIIPAQATAPALIFVGVLMLAGIKEVDFADVTNALPAFCTIVFMPFTYSIANGIAIGLIIYCIVKAFTGQAKEIKPLTLIIALTFAFRYAFITLG